MSIEYNSQYPIWGEFLSSLQRKVPKTSYPACTKGTVLMGGVCGLGHRLVRNAKIYHHARSLGFKAGVFWFPYKELFYDNEFIYHVEDDLSEKNRFVNEPNDIYEKSGKTTPFSDITLNPYFDFNLDKGSKKQWINRYTKWLLDEASLKEVAIFHVMLISLLKERWVAKIEAFLNPLVSKEVIGFHIRTGNGEGGDFAMKKRGIDSEAIITNFISHINGIYDQQKTVLFVATDDPHIPKLIKENYEFEVYSFTNFFPEKGIITGDWSSGESDLPKEKILLTYSFFEAYADMCILGLLKTLYIAAPSSFLIGSCIFNKLNNHEASEIFIYNSDLERWQFC